LFCLTAPVDELLRRGAERARAERLDIEFRSE
jgi:hypothetical protein